MRSIAIRLTLAFMCVILFIVAQGGFAHYNARTLATVQREALTKQMRIVTLQEDLARIRLTVFKLLGTMDPDVMDVQTRRYAERITPLSEALSAHGIPPALVMDNRSLYDRIIDLHYGFSVKTARSLINTRSKEVHEAIVAALEDRARETEARANRQVQQARRTSLFTTAGLLAAALVVAFVWAVVLMRSLTDRRKAEAALQESEERYRLVFNLSKDAIFMTAADGSVIDGNPAAMELFGLSEDEDADRLRAGDFWVDPGARDRFVAALAEKGHIARHEPRLRRKDGEEFIAIGSAATIETAQGRFIVNILHDITARKRMEEALQKSEERLRAVFEAARNVAFVITDARDPIPSVIEFSPGAEKAFGYARSEMIGKPVAPLHPPEDVAKIPEIHQKMRQGGMGFSGEATLVRRSGETFPALFTTYPLLDETGRMYAALGVSIDISDRKRLERQLQQAHKLEAIGIAHEFNNIIGILLGFSELIQLELPESSPSHPRLRKMIDTCLRAREIVQQLLSFSRKSEENPEPMALNPIVKETMKFLRSSIPTSIDFEVDVPSDYAMIMADSTQIHQVLLNLCTNAAQAMEESGGKLTVRLDHVDLGPEAADIDPELTPGPYARLTVGDTGPGIPSDLLGRIFDPYFTTKEVGKGSGMGLAVVHGIVKGGGGAVQVETAPGRGTGFHLYFPAVRRSAERKDRDDPADAQGTGSILFVDDEELMVDVGKGLMERMGYHVTAETDPEAALRRFQADPRGFDLLVTDMSMRHMDGDVLARRVLALRPDMPVILCTGYNERISEEKAQAMGIRKYIEKPIDRHVLGRAIREALNGE